MTRYGDPSSADAHSSMRTMFGWMRRMQVVCLLGKTRSHLHISEVLPAKDLERDVGAAVHGFRFVDLSHASFPELAREAIAPRKHSTGRPGGGAHQLLKVAPNPAVTAATTLA
jgi:hypothetical protein